jgi:signal transduction histidine kinase
MGENQIIIAIILFNLFFLLFIVGIIVFIQQYKLKKKEHLATLTFQQEKHQKELLENQIEIQNQTMQHIGREIHDNVGQKLTLASLYTQQLAYENKAPQINENIENISQIINESLSDLRELSKSLTDDSISKNSIYKLIENEVRRVQKTQKCAITFVSGKSKVVLNDQQKSIVLRICQEFIQNSLKHAQCKTIQIELKKNDNELLFKLQDDGIGFDATKTSNGIGIENIKKRTKILNGSCNLSSDAQSGTCLLISIPLHSNELR